MNRVRRLVLRFGVAASLVAAGLGVQAAHEASAASAATLVLYDSTGPYGWLGEQYAILAANLSSRFGTWKAKRVTDYQPKEIANYRATIYVGSTYDEPLPTAFLDDVIAKRGQVMWLNNNIWQLTARQAATTGTFLASTDGWDWSGFDTASVPSVTYKQVDLSRDPLNVAGIMNVQITDPARASVVATAKRADGTTFPWAVRSANLTYIGELPFAYVNETDRYLAFADMLFDLHAPKTSERHQALVRIEDVSPDADPADLRAIADYLASESVPFSMQIVPRYRDPNGVYHTPNYTERLAADAEMVSALRYVQSKGGTLVMHGWTHQYSNVVNPYTGASTDDFEFYRSFIDAQNNVQISGPVSTSLFWNQNRMQSGLNDLAAAGITRPQYQTLPHYAGSVETYQAVKALFAAGYERRLYFNGAITGAKADYTRPLGQFFPYPVTDVYGGRVIPENLGNEEPEPFNNHPARLPADIINNARVAKVVRDGFASFFWHHYLASDAGSGIAHLREIVRGIKALGYTFVSPTAALAATTPPPLAVAAPATATAAAPAADPATAAAPPVAVAAETRRKPKPTPSLGEQLEQQPDVGHTVSVEKVR